MYKKYYLEFLKGHQGYLHLASHSHHFWPDITKKAVLESWQDSAILSDRKWEKIFSKVLPKTQGLIAKILNLSHSEQIAFAPNTHELLSRLLSSFLGQNSFKLLTTESEFHSFSRQISRLQELNNFEVIKLDNEIESFQTDFLNNITDDLDMIFISHVFFNSGQVLDFNFIKKIIAKKNKHTVFCLDGYHGFCAIPTDLSEIENDIYYLAGGYKYAQAGEGSCFMTIPKNCTLRPANTGWFASFETLDKENKEVAYSSNGLRFWGATMDLTALYRFNYVWDQFFEDGLEIKKIHNYIQSLQTYFINELEEEIKFLNTDLESQGHFLTLEFSEQAKAQDLHQILEENGILTDFRGNRLRFGFGLYLDQDDVEIATTTIKAILKKKASIS